ncbi:hypothetical protein D3C71_1284810 [compost metagenome]
MRHALRFPDHRYHHVGFLRRLYRFVNHLLRWTGVKHHRRLILVQVVDNALVLSDVGPLGIEDFRLVAHRTFQPFAEGHRLFDYPSR